MNFFPRCSHAENFFMTHKITLDSACFPEHISWIRRVFQNTFPCVLCVAIDQRIWMVIQTILSPLPPSRHWCFNREVISFVSYHRRYSLHISDIIDHNDEGTCRIMTKGHVEFLNHKLKGKSNFKSILLANNRNIVTRDGFWMLASMWQYSPLIDTIAQAIPIIRVRNVRRFIYVVAQVFARNQ